MSFGTPSTRSVSSSSSATRPSSIDTAISSISVQPNHLSLLKTPPHISRNHPCIPSDDEDGNDEDSSSDDGNDDPALRKKGIYPLLELPTVSSPVAHRRTLNYEKSDSMLLSSQKPRVLQCCTQDTDDEDDNQIIGDTARRFLKQQTHASSYTHTHMQAKPHRNTYPPQSYPCQPNMPRARLSGIDLIMQREQSRAEMLQRQTRNKNMNPSHAKIEGLLARLPDQGTHTINFQQHMPQQTLPIEHHSQRPTSMTRQSHPQYHKRCPISSSSTSQRSSSYSKVHPTAWQATSTYSYNDFHQPTTRPQAPSFHSHDGISVRSTSRLGVDGRVSPTRNAAHFMHTSSVKKNRNSSSGGSRPITTQ